MDARCLLFQPLGAGAEGFEKKKKKKNSRGSSGCLAPSSWSEALPLSVVKEEKKKKKTKPGSEVPSTSMSESPAMAWLGQLRAGQKGGH